jgi:DNA repair photolyase
MQYLEEMDYKALKNQIYKFQGQKTHVANLLKMGFPVCVSNTSDPFCTRNDDMFLQVREWFGSRQIPIAYQTKGGRYAFETLESHAPTYVYISITSDDDDLLKKFEPGAPRYAERMALAKMCKEKGHFVVIGLNPFVPQWWFDIEKFLDDLNTSGIRHIWMGQMHIRKNKVKLKYKEYEDYGSKIVKPDQPLVDYWHFVMNHNFKVFYHSQSENHDFWNEYFNLLPWFPTIDEFFGICQKQQQRTGKPVAYTVDDFMKYLGFFAELPFKSRFFSYLNNQGQTLRKNFVNKISSTRQMVEILFDVLEYLFRFCKDQTYVLVENHDANDPVLDEDCNYILVYDDNCRDGEFTRFVKEVVFLERG